jgi:hypothetical protein
VSTPNKHQPEPSILSDAEFNYWWARANWEKFECENCGDCHKPEVECYCGCRDWKKGEPLNREEPKQ